MKILRRKLIKTGVALAVGSVFNIGYGKTGNGKGNGKGKGNGGGGGGGDPVTGDDPYRVDSQFDGSVQNVPRWENELPRPQAAIPLSAGEIPSAYNGIAVGDTSKILHGTAPEFFDHPDYWDERPTQYHLMVAKSGQQFELPTSMGLQTPFWGYGLTRSDGTVGPATSPGPQFRFRYGQPTVVRTLNNLEEEISTHMHGGHWPSHSDGHASFFVLPGEMRDYYYPNVLPRTKSGQPDISEASSTLWYHDHAQDITALHVARGMAGTAPAFDDLELELIRTGVLPGIPGQTEEQTIYNNPYDTYLAFMDKVYHPSGALWYDSNNHNGYIGNVQTINGKAYPFMKVEPRKYRFRLTGSYTARHFRFRMSDNSTMLRIGNDAFLFPRGQVVQAVGMAPGKRVDVIIDFSKYQPGDQIYLENILHQEDERGPDGKLEDIENPVVSGEPDFRHRVLRFDVVENAHPSIPNASITENTSLRPHEPIPDSDIEIRRRFKFERKNGKWAINGGFYDPAIANAVPRRDSAEEWILENGGGGWWHPIHIHLESHQQMENLDTRSAPPYQNSFKQDVTMLGPNSEIRIRMRFRTFLGPFMYHCHNNEHEDMEMMFQFEVSETPSQRPQPVNLFFP
jgi:FtsP/CotA-like multicopper oxidase with cupredoxin domain